MAARGNLCVVANRVLGILGSEDVRKIGSVRGVLDDLVGLKNAISVLEPLLLDAEKKAADDERVKDWVMRLEEGLYEADNLLEELATEANTLSKQVRRSFFSTTRPVSRFNVHHKLKYVSSILHPGIEKEVRESGLEERSDKQIQVPSGPEEDRSFEVEGGSVFSTRDMYKMAMINTLLDMELEVYFNATVLDLSSTEELETTRLTRDVFNNERLKNHFQKRIWIWLSSQSDDCEFEILQDVAACLGHRKMVETNEYNTTEKLIHLLAFLLSGVRYLLVLDALKETGPYYFLLESFARIGERGSKIITNTRQRDEPKWYRSSSILSYCWDCPSEKQYWSLFKKVAFGELPKTSYKKGIGKEIVKRCVGFPLAITAIGRMLYYEKSETEWRLFYENEFSRISSRESYDPFPFVSRHSNDYPEELLFLKLCYDRLPSPLKHCFAYCCLFPKDHEIDVQTMIKLWMAQGYIIFHPRLSPEETGYEYFLILLGRAFFHDHTVDARGRVISCKMHNLMHDLATLVAGSQCTSSSQNTDPVPRPVHVSFGFGSFATNDVPKLSTADDVRSILLWTHSWGKYNKGRRDAYGILDPMMISRHRFLRALDMRGFGIKIVPDSISELKLLKYLDLSENGDITKLPNSITMLLNLQTLRLSSCFRLRQLPRDIRNMVNLRHLEIDGCYSLTGMPRGFGQLTNLQTLTPIFLSEDSSLHDVELNEVNSLGNLREEFQMRNLKHEKDVATYLNIVPSGVRSLSLEWESHATKFDYDEKFHPLDSDEINIFSDLEELAVNGFKGDKLFLLDFFLGSNIVKLSLRRCVYCRNLYPLIRVVHLKVLILDELIELEYILHNDGPSSTRFSSSLKELWLTELPKLRGWWKNRGNVLPSFPCLSKLVIEDCPKLDSMPLFPTLEEGLVLDTTCWKPFKLTMSNEVSSLLSSSSSSSSSTSSTCPPLSKLKNLCIVGIEELDNANVGGIMWITMQSLLFLRLDCLPQLKTLPQEVLKIINLQELHIWRCGMEEIDGIEALQYLEKLVIRVCPNMESLPQGIRSLKNLITLEIEDCPTLLRRCEKKTGADWDKIAHIPEKHLGPISGN